MSLQRWSRQVVCRLDGVWITDLLYGDERTIEVLPGEHELRLHNTLMWRTVRFTVAPGGHARFAVVNRAPAGFYALLLIIGVAPLVLEVQQQGGKEKISLRLLANLSAKEGSAD